MQRNKRLNKNQRREQRGNKSKQIKQDYIKNKDIINVKRQQKFK
jgi:hypothetical protein